MAKIGPQAGIKVRAQIVTKIKAQTMNRIRFQSVAKSRAQMRPEFHYWPLPGLVCFFKADSVMGVYVQVINVMAS